MDNTKQEFQADLQAISQTAQLVAQNYKDDMLALLKLLRVLENLHREIRDSLFREALPTSRQALYALLKDIETEGGWPYIPRMKLQSLLANLQPSDSEPSVTHPSSD